MDKAERARLLRERFTAKGGKAYVPTGKPRRYVYVISGRPISMAWPEANRDTTRAGSWMHRPDPQPEIIPMPKRRTGAPVLAKIAAKAPKKLARNFATAEQLLAARVRQ